MAKTKETTEVNFVPFQEVGLLLGRAVRLRVPLAAAWRACPLQHFRGNLRTLFIVSAVCTIGPPYEVMARVRLEPTQVHRILSVSGQAGACHCV